MFFIKKLNRSVRATPTTSNIIVDNYVVNKILEILETLEVL